MKLLSSILILILALLQEGFSQRVFNCSSIFNKSDVTAELEKALNSDYDIIIIPKMDGGATWFTGPLRVKNGNKKIVIEDGVQIKAVSKEAYQSSTASLITFDKATNIEVIGQGTNSLLSLPKTLFDGGEWRMGISLRGCQNITISGISIDDTAGDGIYIGSKGGPCKNIKIESCTINQAARNGISVISCVNLMIKNCTIQNTSNIKNKKIAVKGPFAGIDIEPNHFEEKVEDVRIENCNIKNNLRCGIIIYGKNFDNSSNKTISIINNTIETNPIAIDIGGLEKYSAGKIEITKNKIYGIGKYCFRVSKWRGSAISISISQCKIESRYFDNVFEFLIPQNIREEQIQLSNNIIE